MDLVKVIIVIIVVIVVKVDLVKVIIVLDVSCIYNYSMPLLCNAVVDWLNKKHTRFIKEITSSISRLLRELRGNLCSYV